MAGLIGNVILFVPRVALGAITGTAAAMAKKGCVDIVAPPDGFTYKTAADFVANKVIGPGFEDLKNSGVGNAFADIRTAGLKEGFQAFMSKLGSTGPRGWMLLGGAGLGSAFAITMGWSLFKRSQKMLKDLSTHGHCTDMSQKQSIHGGRLLAGGALLGGGILTLIPGCAAVGLPLMFASAAGAGALHIGRYLDGGAHMGRNSELAPWPFNIALRPFSGRQTWV